MQSLVTTYAFSSKLQNPTWRFMTGSLSGAISPLNMGNCTSHPAYNSTHIYPERNYCLKPPHYLQFLALSVVDKPLACLWKTCRWQKKPSEEPSALLRKNLSTLQDCRLKRFGGWATTPECYTQMTQITNPKSKTLNPKD